MMSKLIRETIAAFRKGDKLTTMSDNDAFFYGFCTGVAVAGIISVIVALIYSSLLA